jgi:hypothetical protein
MLHRRAARTKDSRVSDRAWPGPHRAI